MYSRRFIIDNYGIKKAREEWATLSVALFLFV